MCANAPIVRTPNSHEQYKLIPFIFNDSLSLSQLSSSEGSSSSLLSGNYRNVLWCFGDVVFEYLDVILSILRISDYYFDQCVFMDIVEACRKQIASQQTVFVF